MNRILLSRGCIFTAAMMVSLAGTLSAAAPSNQVVLENSIKAVRPDQISAVASPADLSKTRRFMISMKLRNFEDLKARVAGGEVVSPEEMAAKYYPAEADYLTVRQWLETQGFQVVRTDVNRLALFAQASLHDIRERLGSEFAHVQTADGDFVSAVSAPVVPSYVASLIQGINGLQPQIRMHRHSRKISPIMQRDAGQNPQSQTVPNLPPFLVSELSKAYGLTSVAATGNGQTIAIVIDTFPLLSDLTAFWSINAVPQTTANITFIPVVDIISNYPAPSGEETLDVEWSSGIASGARIRVYGSEDLTTDNIDACLMQLLDDVPSQPTMHQLSMSFGIGELEQESEDSAEIGFEHSLFMSMAASGISIFASSGDMGSNIDGQTQVSYPASDPNITGVGGTSLTLRSCSGVVTSETAWSGSGGGISAVFPRPSYQSSLTISSAPSRLVPDVSAVADPNTGALVILNGLEWQFGGTSLSSPVWAGFNAVINQARANASLSAVGPLNQKIYSYLGTTAFRDITGGSSNGSYSAAKGYDLVTGLGSPNVAVLVSALANGTTPPPAPTPAPTPIPTPTPAYGVVQSPDITCPLTGSAVTFSWATSPGTATANILTAGKTQGSSEFFNSGQTGAKFVLARNLPTDGRTVWIRLWSLVGGHWFNPPQDYQYSAAALAVLAPVFGPVPGTYKTKTVVNMASATPGATIRYTTNGATPTSASLQFTKPITLSTTTTVRAIAQKAGVPDSAVTLGTYTIKK